MNWFRRKKKAGTKQGTEGRPPLADGSLVEQIFRINTIEFLRLHPNSDLWSPEQRWYNHGPTAEDNDMFWKYPNLRPVEFGGTDVARTVYAALTGEITINQLCYWLTTVNASPWCKLADGEQGIEHLCELLCEWMTRDGYNLNEEFERASEMQAELW